MPIMLVTGANRGLGLEFVRQYRADGWDVIAACRRVHEGAAAQALGARVEPLDVADHGAIAALARRLEGQALDVLINNAGLHPGTQALGHLDYSKWLQAFQINTIAPLQMAEAFFPLMPRGGKIINIGSRQGSIACNEGGRYQYRATKAALNSITRGLSIDLAPKGIFVAALHPGWVKTDMGGASAEIDPIESIAGMRAVIAGLGAHNTGQLIQYDGQVIPW